VLDPLARGGVAGYRIGGAPDESETNADIQSDEDDVAPDFDTGAADSNIGDAVQLASASPELLAKLKQFEGFAPKASWDYHQYSNGYGTKAQYPGETIDRTTAEKRLQAEADKASDLVDHFAPNLPPGVRKGLTDLTHNSGTKWMNQSLGKSILAGDYDTAKQQILAYNNAGGKPLPGLTARRQADAAMFDDSASSDAGVGRYAQNASPSATDASSSPRATSLFGKLFGISPEANQAIMAAGAAMMAGQSPYATQNIGAGLAAGLRSYTNSEQLSLHAKQIQQQLDRQAEMTKIAKERNWIMQAGVDARVAQQQRIADKPIKMTDERGRDYLADPHTGLPIAPPQSPSPTAPAPTPPDTSQPKPAEAQPRFMKISEEDENGLPESGTFKHSKLDHDVNPGALEGLSSGDRNRIIAMSEGREAFLPTGGRNRENAFLMSKLFEYDPLADKTAYGRRQRTENFFAVGTQGGGGQNIAAMNTWAQHMDDYLRLSQKLDLGRWTTWNDAVNWMTSHGYTSKEAQDTLGQLALARKAVADEGAKIFAGTNSALADREEWGRLFDLNTPRSVSLAKAKEAAHLIAGRLSSLADQYNQGNRTSHEAREFLAPRTREVMKRLGEAKEEYSPLGGTEEKKTGEGGSKRTIVRSGTVNAGPNAGKKVIEYSDGTREYQ